MLCTSEAKPYTQCHRQQTIMQSKSMPVSIFANRSENRAPPQTTSFDSLAFTLLPQMSFPRLLGASTTVAGVYRWSLRTVVGVLPAALVGVLPLCDCFVVGVSSIAPTSRFVSSL
eukprot:Filipodium_phascolosomae@DN1793_c0_g1_i1.p1